MAEKQKLSESDTIILSLHERWWKKMLSGEKVLELQIYLYRKQVWTFRGMLSEIQIALEMGMVELAQEKGGLKEVYGGQQA